MVCPVLSVSAVNVGSVSRYRLLPAPEQVAELLEHCAQARFVWNLACEQHAHWRPGRAAAPGYNEQARQLTEARAEFAWLRAGSVTVQQQALRDFAQAMSSFFRGIHRRPSWRKAGRDEGFRQVGVKSEHVQRLNRRYGRVWVLKVGWVRFRWSRAEGVKSYRVTCDRAGRWHVAFAAIPDPIPAPGNGQTVGLDRGIAVSAALSTGELLVVAGFSQGERRRLRRLQRRLARCARGSNRRARVKAAIARVKARVTERRKDWVEKISTDLARRFDLIRVEDLDIRGMTRSAKGTVERPGRNVGQKAGLNRGILANGWGLLVARLQHKAAGRVRKVRAAYTSQQCSACGHIAPENRQSQAVFRCVACGFACHADVNAARNIAAGRAVTARGALQPLGGAVNREPHLATSAP
ncbi:RNA-guided endonuclease InsQ/TnpB family protein [Kibdelosporangium banguiense]|uniref:RNA-guided endonuclease InsQ/TnpB family protein n=1 Tax=Kibdelosporangium banguiense TaxID=1365924 RepID=UPI002479CF24|nr:transposase [Kibdelosporangium banguiense]